MDLVLLVSVLKIKKVWAGYLAGLVAWVLAAKTFHDDGAVVCVVTRVIALATDRSMVATSLRMLQGLTGVLSLACPAEGDQMESGSACTFVAELPSRNRT